MKVSNRNPVLIIVLAFIAAVAIGFIIGRHHRSSARVTSARYWQELDALGDATRWSFRFGDREAAETLVLSYVDALEECREHNAHDYPCNGSLVAIAYSMMAVLREEVADKSGASQWKDKAFAASSRGDFRTREKLASVLANLQKTRASRHGDAGGTP